ncbi:MAG: TonB-dependent receptor [bacterium]|nr:TonB-dependent receptor [bacterium]
MRYQLIIVLISVILFDVSQKCLGGQNNVSGASALCGYVVDRSLNLPLPDATILLNNTKIEVSTDYRGEFSISGIDTGTYCLTVNRYGYVSYIINDVHIDNKQKTYLKIEMIQKPINLPHIIVYADKKQSILDDEGYDGINQVLTAYHKNETPGGMNDVFRAVTFSPSVVNKNDLSGLLYVRGGSPDQNMVIIDNLEIYYPYRMRLAMGGGMSYINSELVQYTELIPGGFPARYGNRLSSVLKVTLREDSLQQRSLNFNLDMLSFSSSFQSPIHNNRGHFICSLRGSYNYIVDEFLRGNYVVPSFQDFYSKISYNISPDNKLTINFLHATEGMKLSSMKSEEMDVSNKINNSLIGLNWLKLLNQKTIVNTSLSYYSDKNRIGFFDINNYLYNANLKFNIQYLNLLGKVQYYYNPDIQLEFGANAKILSNDMDWSLNWRTKIDFPLSIYLNTNFILYGNYIELKHRISDKLTLLSGVRFDHSTLNKQNVISPRFSFSYDVKPGYKIFGATGNYFQYPHLMTLITRGEPLDFTNNMPSLKAEKATHFILGMENNWKNLIRSSVTGYYKKFANLLLPADYLSFRAENSGEGFSNGLEFSISNILLNDNTINWRVNYSIARSSYRKTNQQQWLPFNWDQRHSLDGIISFNIFPNFNIGIRGQYGSGFPYTSLMNFDSRDIYRHVYATRYPSYIRFDTKVRYFFNASRYIRSEIYLDLINITDRKNVYAYKWDFHDAQYQNEDHQATIYSIPFMFSLGFKMEL